MLLSCIGHRKLPKLMQKFNCCHQKVELYVRRPWFWDDWMENLVQMGNFLLQIAIVLRTSGENATDQLEPTRKKMNKEKNWRQKGMRQQTFDLITCMAIWILAHTHRHPETHNYSINTQCDGLSCSCSTWMAVVVGNLGPFYVCVLVLVRIRSVSSTYVRIYYYWKCQACAKCIHVLYKRMYDIIIVHWNCMCGWRQASLYISTVPQHSFHLLSTFYFCLRKDYNSIDMEKR